ncbi:hypothetical protein C0993_004151 [Termitomyces sp. T159_Od127]|nr:hypothetical protein C0993_004151 [Termitomyces sp. T159_Od127]
MSENRGAGTHSTPAVIRSVPPLRNEKSSKPTTNSPRRGRRNHIPVKPVNDAKLLRRWKVIEEFYETERTYVEGLDLIHSVGISSSDPLFEITASVQHFLAPIIVTLDKSEPLLDCALLTSVFSNFIDIWNLHRSFFSSLTTFLTTSGIPSTFTDKSETPPPLSPLLLSHFPYLSLYNLFVTAFPTAISNLTDLVTPPSSSHPNPKYSAPFATFLANQESDPRCGKLKLRDWLLTVVQRCPRYLLLLKDLIACTDEEDPEYAHLEKVQALVSKVTLSLNTSLHTHAQTLALLSLQRATLNLPFQLILPGPTFLRRGSLLQIERSGLPCEREFLLFSDCLIWLAGEAVERAQWKGDWRISRSAWGLRSIEPNSLDQPPPAPERLSLSQESKSCNESEDEALSDKVDCMKTNQQELLSTTPTRPNGKNRPRKSYHPHPHMIKRRNSSRGNDERWIFKGRTELIDLEVVVTPATEEGEERRFEILSPEGSFVLYTATGEDRDRWCNEIRQAKAQLLSSLNVTHPNSTLTSSSSTNHLRRTLQALPFSPSGQRVAADRAGKSDGKNKGKTDAEPHEWRRKKFFISDPHAKDDSSVPARACNACYETVFPLIDPVPGATLDVTGTTHECDADSFPSLNSLPSWLSMPSFSVTTTPQALMAIDREPTSSRNSTQDFSDHDRSEIHKRVRARPLRNTQVRGNKEVLVDLEQNDNGRFDLLDSPLKEESDRGKIGFKDQNGFNLSLQSSQELCLPSSPRKDDTTKRKKRLSLPAVALHTTNVTTRTFDDDDFMQDGPESPFKASKRFSLMLGSGGHHGNNGLRNQSEAMMSPGGTDSAAGTRHGLGKSIAAGILGEILARKRD